MRRRCSASRLGACGALLAAALVLPGSNPAAAIAPPAELVSINPADEAGMVGDSLPSISDDGNFITFTRLTPVNAGPSATPHLSSFLKERSGDIVSLEEIGSGVGDGLAQTASATISADGCTVAFFATSFVSDFDGGFNDDLEWDLYLWHRCLGGSVAEIESTLAFGSFTAEGPGRLSLSHDGAMLAVSIVRQTVSNIGITAPPALFVMDMDPDTAQTGRVDAPASTPALTYVNSVDISRDGTAVAAEIQTGAVTALAPPSVIVWRPGGSVTVVPLDGLNVYPNNGASQPSISADGSLVAYTATQRVVVGEFPNDQSHIYLRRLTPGTPQTSRFTPDSLNLVGNFADPELSSDGTQIAFASLDSDYDNVWVAHSASPMLANPTFELISYDATADASTTAFGFSRTPVMSANGRHVVFQGTARARLLGLTDSFAFQRLIYLRERKATLTVDKLTNFGDVIVGQSSTPQTVTVGNTSNVPAEMGSTVVSLPEFEVTADTCTGTVLLPGATCTITLVFTPSTPGPASATIDLAGGGTKASGGLNGRGVAPIRSFSVGAIDFGSVTVGTTSATRNALVRNTGQVTTSIGTVSINSTRFAVVADGCTEVTLAPNATCTIGVRFSPTAAGAVSASLTVSDGTATGAGTLRGTGLQPPPPTTPPVVVRVGRLSIVAGDGAFGDGLILVPSATRSFTVRNIGNASVTVGGTSLSGSGAARFEVVNTSCAGRVLAPNATCSVTVRARHSVVGTASASLVATGIGVANANRALTSRTFAPTLRFNPGVVHPGEVSTLVGSGFPANTDVKLAYNGDVSTTITIRTDGDGGITRREVVFRNSDRVGASELTVTAPAFLVGVKAPLLIDLATFAPSGSSNPAFTNGVRALVSRGG